MRNSAETGPVLTSDRPRIHQVVPAVPFLLTNPVAYVTRAFDFGRVFFYKWTGMARGKMP